MQKLIEKIGRDLDPDILETMMEVSEFQKNTVDKYQNWEICHDPLQVMLDWQKIRNLKNG